MFKTIASIIHVVVAFLLIGIVLLQQGKGAEIGATFGGSNQTLFGSSGGSTFFGKITTAVAVAFMATCLLLGYLSTGPTGSVMESATPAAVEQPAKAAVPVPEVPAATEARPKAADEVPLPKAAVAKDAKANAPQGAKKKAADKK